MRRGFTLIETLIVVAILGLLASRILIPSFSAAKKRAEAARSVSDSGRVGCVAPQQAASEAYYRFSITQYANGFEVVEDTVTGRKYLCRTDKYHYCTMTPLLGPEKLEKE